MESAGTKAIFYCVIVGIVECDHRLSSDFECKAVTSAWGRSTSSFSLGGKISRAIMKNDDTNVFLLP